MRFLISVIGCLYLLVGLGSLVPFVTILLYGPALTLDTMGLRSVIWYAFPLLNATVCVLLAYAFLTLRRWGRSVAIVYNGLWLALMALGLAYSRLIEMPTASWTTAASAFLIVVSTFLIGVILICSTETARRLMST